MAARQLEWCYLSPAHLLHDDRSEPEAGLVAQQQLRLAHEGSRDGEHLLLAAGEAAGLLRTPLTQTREHLEPVVDVGRRIVAPDIRANAKVVLDGEIDERAPTLGNLRDPFVDDRVGRRRAEALARELDRSTARDRARDGAHRCRLAGAVGAEHNDDFAHVHRQVDPVQNLNGSVAGMQPADVEQCGHAAEPR